MKISRERERAICRNSLLFIEYHKYVKDSKYNFFKKLQFSDDWTANQLSPSVLTKEKWANSRAWRYEFL